MKHLKFLITPLFLVLLAATMSCNKKNSPASAEKKIEHSWTAIMAEDFPKDAVLQQTPMAFQAWKLDLTRLRSELGADSTDKSRIDTVLLPFNDGTLQAFAIQPANTMSAALQAKYPDIRAWSGKGLQHPNQRAKLNLDAKGFRGMVQTQAGTLLIEPAIAGSTVWYMAFLKNDLPVAPPRQPSAPEGK